MKSMQLEDEKNFEIQEVDEGEQQAERKNTRCCCWCGTWNNPSMTDEEFEKFFTDLENDDVIKYAIFQREKGEKTGTIHFQFFVDFKSPVRFTKVKSTLPYGCHFKPMISTKARCQAYCSKADTRVSGPYEIGEMVEERQRTDLDRAIKMIDEGFSLVDIDETFPKQSFMYSRLFKARFWSRLERIFGNTARNIEVTFIYGDPGTGKTTFVNSQVEHLNDLFRIDSYGDYWFTGYMGQDTILLDEFTGQVKIPKMNKLLDRFPQRMNIKGGDVPACFTKVYIVSNLSLKELYIDYQKQIPKLYQAFCRRINKILHFVSEGKYIIERETVWEDLPVEQQFNGITRKVKRVVDYIQGVPKIVYDAERGVQTELELKELKPEESGDLPW